ncbi:MAG: acyl-ACP desaturase [Actinomycetota bacterium]
MTVIPAGRVDLLVELADDAERLYNRHLEAPRLWFPHEQIDWGSGEDFKDKPWEATDYELSDGVRSAIYTNLLTEDNLPYYTETIMGMAPRDHPLNAWTRQWTMEENRHSMVMRDWVHISRCINPVTLEEGRVVQMSSGVVPRFDNIGDMIAYVSMQERATQIAHRNTATKLPKDDKQGRNVLALIAGDETKHYMFYRDLTKAAFELDPSTLMEAVNRQVEHFAMPGVGIPNFTKHAVRIAREGIYGVQQFLKDVVEPVMEFWDIEHIEGLNAEAEKARVALFEMIEKLKVAVERTAQKAAASAARA